MNVVFYQTPSWIFTDENKPSKQTFQQILSSYPAVLSLQAQTVQTISLDSISIQASLDTQYLDKLNFNLVKFQNRFYVVQSLEVVQIIQNSFIVEITAYIDVYLSFVVDLFDEQTTTNKTVFFKQKHMNENWYINNKPEGPYFQNMFWLLNVHPQLKNLGTKPELVQTNYYGQFSNFNDFVAKWWALPNPPQATAQNSYFEWSSYYGFNTLPDNDIYTVYYFLSTKWNPENIFIQNNYNSSHGSYLSITGPLNPNCWVPLFQAELFDYPAGLATYSQFDFMYIAQFMSSSQYNGVYAFPLPLTFAFEDYYGSYMNGSSYTGNTGLIPAFPNPSNLPTMNGSSKGLYVEQAGLIYSFIHYENVQKDTDFAQIFTTIKNYRSFLYPFLKLNFRNSGQDGYVDLTCFNWALNFWAIATYLTSFKVTGVAPHFQISNIDAQVDLFGYSQLWSTLAGYPNETWKWLTANSNSIIWNKASTGSPLYVIDMKNELPTMSNGWNNYLESHKNAYNLGKNLAHLTLQRSEADMAFDVTKSVVDASGTVADAFLDPAEAFEAASRTVGALEGVTNEAFAIKSNQLQYNYQKYGMKGDLSRVGAERTANQTNEYTASNMLLQMRLEAPLPFEINAITQYYDLYGFIVERWVGFKYWNNRKYVNYVKCLYFAQVMLSNLPLAYRQKIDKILIGGIRIWNLASFPQNFNFLNFENLFNQNTELSSNNDEASSLI